MSLSRERFRLAHLGLHGVGSIKSGCELVQGGSMATNAIQNSESMLRSGGSGVIGANSKDVEARGVGGEGGLSNVGRAVPPVSGASAFQIGEDQIRQRAYELYLARQNENGGGEGDAESDWTRAERELREAALSRFQRSRDVPTGAGHQPASGIAGRSSPRLFSGG